MMQSSFRENALHGLQEQLMVAEQLIMATLAEDPGGPAKVGDATQGVGTREPNKNG